MEKVVRSNAPLTYTDDKSRKTTTSVVALKISNWAWNENIKQYEAEVTDMRVTENTNPERQPGEPLYFYEPMKTVKRLRTKQQVNDLFQYFGVTIEPGDDLTDILRDLYARGLLYDTQTTPIYNSTPEQWAIYDRDTEVVPTPEPETE